MDNESVVVTQQERKYKTLVTDIGNTKIANAAFTGEKVNIVSAAVGDGGGSYYVPTADMTDLVNEVWAGPVASVEVNSKSANMLDVKVVIPATDGGFTARECCVKDEDGDMIAVCNLPDTSKAVIEEGISSPLTILMHIVVTNSDALEFTVDPTVDTASAIRAPIIIPREAWTAVDEEDGSPYPYQADAVCAEATAQHTPLVSLDRSSLAAARSCELCPTAEAVTGIVRFWAMRAPDTDMTGAVLLVGQGGGGSSGDGSYTLPTATAFRLGGVKVGDGLSVAQDGTLSVDAQTVVTGEDLVDEEGVQESVANILNGDEA